VYENDAKGNHLVTQYFDIDNKPYETSDGYAKYVNEYDPLGNCISAFYYDKTDSLCLSSDGIAGWRSEYNAQNRMTKVSFYGTDNQPAEDIDGIFGMERVYDSKGNEIQTRYYEADGKTLTLHNTEGIAGWKSDYDDNGNETKREFFDAAEEPAEITYGYARWEAAYDEMSNRTEIAYFDINGGLLYGYKYSYDQRGNWIESFPFDRDRKLTRGMFITRYKYDDRGNRIETAYYDGSDKPVINSNTGYFKVTNVYDDRNQEIERRYYDTRENLYFVEAEGYAMAKYEYDNRGNTIKVSFFDTSEKPLRLADGGQAVRINEIDAMGNLVRTVWFDENMNPTNPAYLIPERLYKYDKWGNQIYFAYADGSGKLMANADGYAVIRSEYDIRGKRIAVSTYDESDKPCLDKQDNSHKIEWTYDKRGNTTEARYYDTSVSLRRDGYAIEKNKYDEQNRLIERAWYDYLDRPFNNGSNGHRYVRSYDAQGIRYDTHYSVNNTIVAEWSYNPATEQWTRIDGWRKYFEDSMSGLPITLNNYTRITAITLNGNSCIITVRINFSKYELSNEYMLTLENEGKSNAQYWWTSSKMPRNATMVVVGVDNAGRELYRVSY
jgi:YD repeat-containing protein